MSTDQVSFELITTADGSTSLYLPQIDETYHSRHGAIQESMHVFIRMGLQHVAPNIGQRVVRILEVGFGTGLNALLTAQVNGVSVHYTGIDTVPLPEAVYRRLSFDGLDNKLLLAMHETEWDTPYNISAHFVLHKMLGRVQDIDLPASLDLVYYDAFGPRAQGEMWELPVFERLAAVLVPGGVLVTYCAKGQVRRDLQTAGFDIERLTGPPGKREMLRATKR